MRIPKVRQQFNCLHCGNVIQFKGYSNTHKYCNHRCHADHKLARSLVKFRAAFYLGECHSRPRIRQVLTVERGYKCEVCGISEWNNKDIVLQVDHVNGDAEDNMPSNLRLICPNCHSQTATFAGANRGNGRWSKEGWTKTGR